MLPFTHINFFLTTILIIALVYFLTTNTFHFNKRHEEEKKDTKCSKASAASFFFAFRSRLFMFQLRTSRMCMSTHGVIIFVPFFFFNKSPKKNVFYWKWLGGNGKVSERVECIETNIIKKIIIIIVIHTHTHTYMYMTLYSKKRCPKYVYQSRKW